ncbi:hypothetical protein [Beijerinckia indica]|uniref:Uncharacterized protein n=1 Tax=Beijerinckia indica subsp. indica (strain ATCC 9039 / DSM 1715 / NCIMB 8712) TaxID=395963 RepID=B2IC60_BEII9|nr:hypothetical protein [Beijerinckia indica]ACB96657.1 conserved hypothetical protein [Beijerinckia indica subsp. indica ATCC 9039]
MKSDIIERLGESEILLPSLIQDGLHANDQVKLRLAVLQAAARRAQNPTVPPFDLQDECRAAGIDPLPMETLVQNARLVDPGRISAPGLDTLAAAIWQDVTTMANSVKAGDQTAGEAGLARLAALQAALKDKPENQGPADTMAVTRIAQLGALSAHHEDSLHRLVMDLHKALNQLAAAHAEEICAGAHVYGLTPEDRPLVEAFMRGLESTRKLKFNHPGLATTAMRSTGKLVIQNDIGETEAHVVVITIDPAAVTITYTDVHLDRARFFANLFDAFAVQWSGLERKDAQGIGDEEPFYLTTGRFAAVDQAHRSAFLAALGSSLVFLIDWNKARKLLRTWMSKADAGHILEWAARNRFGHRAFLELGGGDLIASAVRNTTPTRIGFGERLDHALGREAAVDFLKNALRVASETLLAGSSVRLARDRIEADLMRRLQSVDSSLLSIVVRQAGLARDIADAIAHLIAARSKGQAIDADRAAANARHIEEKADRMAVAARVEIARLNADRAIESLVNRVEETIDEFEQAAFIASLIPEDLPADLLKPLGDLSAAAVGSTQAMAIGAVAAMDVPQGQRVDTEDALEACVQLADYEHRADEAERTLTRLVLRGSFDLRTSLSVMELARALERATDRLAGAGGLLRDHVLADLSK